jgi:hypothetical protein
MALHRDETLAAALSAVGALMTVLAGDGRKDRGLMSRTVYGTRHVHTCNRGLYLYPGSAATGGALCSERCVAAHEAMRLAGVFLERVIDECGEAGPAVAQLRLLEAV